MQLQPDHAHAMHNTEGVVHSGRLVAFRLGRRRHGLPRCTSSSNSRSCLILEFLGVFYDIIYSELKNTINYKWLFGTKSLEKIIHSFLPQNISFFNQIKTHLIYQNTSVLSSPVAKKSSNTKQVLMCFYLRSTANRASSSSTAGKERASSGGSSSPSGCLLLQRSGDRNSK